MPGLYLAALLASSAAMVLIDRRFSLYLFRFPPRALLVQGIGVAAFLAWDFVGIGLGIFFRGAGPYFVGLELAPELPVEEPVFLWFLCHFTMIVFTGADRLARARASRAAGRSQA